MKFSLTTADRQVIEFLRDESAAADSIEAFATEYLPFTTSKFHKILDVLDDSKESSYFDDIKDKESLLQDLREIAEKLPSRKLDREKRLNLVIYPIERFRAVAVAIRECAKKGDASSERVIKYIAPTGGGKTSLKNYLIKEFRNELSPAIVESRDSWRPMNADWRVRAARCFLEDVAAALKLRMGEETRGAGLAGMENEIIRACTSTRRLLFFDEAEFFSRYSLNFIKLLLNKSRVIVVIACTPIAHAAWNRGYTDEALQISRRQHAHFEAVIKSNDAALFFPKDQFEDPEASLKIICEEAARFGHYSTIARIAQKLRKTTRATADEVAEIVNKAMVDMGKSTRKK